MTGRTHDDSDRSASDSAGDGSDKDDFVHELRAHDPLLEAMGAFAREEEAAIATYAASASHTMSDAARERSVQKILALQARERAAGLASEEAQDPRVPPAVPEGRAPLPRHRLSRIGLVMGGGFVTAVLALAVWMRPVAQDLSSNPPLPGYSITARGGIKEARSSASDVTDDARTVAETQRLSAESQLVVALRPRTAVAGSVAARAFVVQGKDAAEVGPSPEVAPTGAMELRFHGSELIGSRHGVATLRVVVGRPQALRALAPASLLAADVTDVRWQVLTVPLELGQP